MFKTASSQRPGFTVKERTEAPPSFLTPEHKEQGESRDSELFLHASHISWHQRSMNKWQLNATRPTFQSSNRVLHGKNERKPYRWPQSPTAPPHHTFPSMCARRTSQSSSRNDCTMHNTTNFIFCHECNGHSSRLTVNSHISLQMQALDRIFALTSVILAFPFACLGFFCRLLTLPCQHQHFGRSSSVPRLLLPHAPPVTVCITQEPCNSEA